MKTGSERAAGGLVHRKARGDLTHIQGRAVATPLNIIARGRTVCGPHTGVGLQPVADRCRHNALLAGRHGEADGRLAEFHRRDAAVSLDIIPR